VADQAVPRAEIERLVGKLDGRLLILYGRVSEQGQKADLDTQLERLQTWAKTERKGVETLVLSDKGSMRNGIGGPHPARPGQPQARLPDHLASVLRRIDIKSYDILLL